MRRLPIALCIASVLFACGGGNANMNGSKCGVGRTELDGVCVSESVADYVSCVRAQGAKLGSDRSSKLSADASFLGVHGGAASDVKDKLEKQYAASDANTLEIIRACNALRAAAPAPAPVAGASSSRRFHWFYTGDSNKRRDWSRNGDRWTERASEDGTTLTFVQTSRTVVDGQQGVEVRRDPPDADRIFIPDPGGSSSQIKYKGGNGPWQSLGTITED